MQHSIPDATIDILARSVHRQADAYGFGFVDHIRLANALLSLDGLDSAPAPPDGNGQHVEAEKAEHPAIEFAQLPLRTDNLCIEPFDPATDLELLEFWMRDSFNRFFLLASSARYARQPSSLVSDPDQHVGVVRLGSGAAIGAVAFLDHDPWHRRAELRFAICDPAHRNRGLGLEAVRAWIRYGLTALSLEKMYVNLIEGDFRSSRMLHGLGFAVEALLRNEIRLDGSRCNVERWGLSSGAPAAAGRNELQRDRPA